MFKMIVFNMSGEILKLVRRKHTISKISFDIVTFLSLPKAKQYTDHSFRKILSTLSTLLANARGAIILDFKQYGG